VINKCGGVHGCRELEQQLKEAVTLAEEADQKRRHLEAQLVAADARAEGLAAQRIGTGAHDERDLELRTLREELAAQEATLREARRLIDNVRCRLKDHVCMCASASCGITICLGSSEKNSSFFMQGRPRAHLCLSASLVFTFTKLMADDDYIT
jgi:hypothetical protein